MITKKLYKHLSLFQIVYLIFVILFGAWVRVTGSGAGCGKHWPLCHGDITPLANSTKSLIEYTHRITSGFTLIIALVILLLSFKLFEKKSLVRKAAGWTVFFVITEALFGAGLVLLEHVAENKSVYRAFSMSIHLVNTFLLVACAILNYDFAKSNVEKLDFKNSKLLFTGLFVLIFIGVSGAITALGDTLFPVTSSGEALQLSFLSSQHLFIKLRVWHPFIAVLGSILVCLIVQSKSHPGGGQDLGTGLGRCDTAGELINLRDALFFLIGLQIILGFVNVALFAPGWMQIVHLAVAEGVWIFFILFFARSLAGENKTD